MHELIIIRSRKNIMLHRFDELLLIVIVKLMIKSINTT